MKIANPTTILLTTIALTACNGDSVSVIPDENGSSNSIIDENTVSVIEENTANAGDDYWRELAQSYPAFVPPPEIGAAHDAAENINLGRWGELIEWPQIATGAANLPDGRILTWSSTQTNNFGSGSAYTHGSIFDPVTETFVDKPHDQHNMFCAGISMLPDGTVFTAGGGATITTTSMFRNGDWSLTDSMTQARWYPQSTTLPSGQVVTSLGTKNTSYSEIWTEDHGWSNLPNANLQTVLEDDTVQGNLRHWFPAMNVAPNGTLFHPGPSSELFSIDLYTEGNAFTSHGKREAGDPHRLYNTTVMYDIGKMLIAGGGKPALNSALTVDVNGSVPVVAVAEPMQYARSMQDSIVLPNGKVLVIGGNSSGVQFSDEGTQMYPEIWDPATGQWQTLAPHSKPRNYHSTALLLKDGRVASMGGGLCGGCATNQQNGEIFEPPYLFNADGTLAARPQITTGPDEAVAGDAINLNASNGIQSFTMLRLVALTHHHTTDQRYVPLTYTETLPGNYRLQLPANTNVLIPGYYWVFALDANGVPSKGHTVLINTTAEAIPQPPAKVEYEYFQGDWDVLPDFDTLTPLRTGAITDFSLSPRQQDDYFAFRYNATLKVTQTGTYTFFTTSDDGSALFVNNQLVVDNDGLHGNVEEQGTIDLTEGNHQLTITFFEKTGGDNLQVQFAGPSISKQSPTPWLTELDEVDTTDPETAVINYEYFEGNWQSLPDFNSLSPVKTGQLQDFDFSPAEQGNYFGFRYNTTIYAAQAGQYTFHTTSDDGSQLFVNNQLVVDNDGLHGSVEEQGTITLTEGQHDIVVTYFERTGGNSLLVEYQGPGITKQVLRPSRAPDATDPPSNSLLNGNFSNGLDSWQACGGQPDASSGNASLSAGGCLYQEFPVVAQASYTLSCDASSSANYASVQLGISDSSYATLDSQLAPVTTSIPTTITASLEAPAGSAIGVITLYAETQATFDNCVITADNSEVEPEPPEPPAQTASNALLLNAAFENDLDSWNSCGGQQAITNGIEGSKALNLSSNGCAYQEIPMTGDATYGLSCTAKSADGYSSLTLTVYDSSFGTLATQELPITGAGFQNEGFELLAPAGAAYGALTLYAETNASFDSCGIVTSDDSATTHTPFVPDNPADNLLANGDFSDGDSDWASCGGSFNIDASGTDNTDAAALAQSGCLYQEFNAEAGKQYQLICSGKSNDYASLTLGFSDIDYAPLAQDTAQVRVNAFSRIESTLTAPVATARGTVTMYAENSAVFDNCVVIEQ